MNKFEEYKMHLSAINSLVKTDGDAMVKGFFETLFTDHKDLDMVLVYGYTPGFNDGDPCYHTQYSILDGEEINDTVDLWDILEIDGDEDEDVLENINSKVSRDDSRKIENKIDGIEDLLERVYDTDFYLFVRRLEDGTIEIDNGDYNCGY